MAIKKKEIDPSEKVVYKTYEDFNVEDLFLYAGLDCIATSTLVANIYPALTEEPEYYIPDVNGKKVLTHAKSILDTNEEVTKTAFEYVLNMEINGLKYDKEKNREISARMVAEIAQLDELIFQKIPIGTNLDSGTEMVNILYNVMGFKPPYRTATGEPSTDGEALLTLAGLDPLNPPKDYKTPDPELQFLAWLAKRKDINSAHNTFIRTYIEDFVKRDGRIHPSYNLHGTSGFRISGESPNLTQLPRPKHGYNIRDCYIVEEGNVFIAFDFSSAEVKILAALCKDPNMLKAVNEGRDFHASSASIMKGVTYEEYKAILADKNHPDYADYKYMRQVAKILECWDLT